MQPTFPPQLSLFVIYVLSVSTYAVPMLQAVEEYMAKLQDDAFRNNEELQHDVHAILITHLHYHPRRCTP